MKKEKIFWGLFFIIAAVVLVMGKLDLLGGINAFTLAATVFLAACLVKSAAHRNMGGIFFSIAFLCILFDKQLGIEALTPWTVLFAALLATIGVGFLYHPKTYYGKNYFNIEESIETAEGAQVNFNTSFSESVKYIDSDDFQSANLKTSFGSLKVYFDNVAIQGKEATVHVNASFGSLQLYVPKQWKVVNGVSAVFGGVEETGRNVPEEFPILKIVGSASFGSVEIIYI